MAGIEELKGKIISKNGMAFSNQFAITLPKKLSAGTELKGLNSRSGNILCKSTTLPGRQINTIDRQIGIFTEKVVNGFAIDEVTMSFYLLNDYGVRKYFDSWSNAMVGTAYVNTQQKKDEEEAESEETSSESIDAMINRIGRGAGSGASYGTVAYKKDYVGDLTIHQLAKPQIRLGFDLGPLNIDFDVLGNSIYSVKLIDAFPTTINAIPLSNDGTISEMTVTFSYTDWEVVKDKRGLLEPKIGLNLGGLI